jgi:hypothetical protein
MSIRADYIKNSFLANMRSRPTGAPSIQAVSKRLHRTTSKAMRQLNAISSRITGVPTRAQELSLRSSTRRATLSGMAAQRAALKKALDEQEMERRAAQRGSKEGKRGRADRCS